MRKFGVIGVGHVGVTVAYTLVTKGIADELVLIDKDQKRAVAEQLDLQDAQARLDTTTNVKIQDYAELKDADVVFITAGRIKAISESKTGSRWAEFEYTRKIVKDIAPQLKDSGFHGVVIVTMNPCDAITQYLQQETGFDFNKVIATGTFLDTTRMQRVVAEKFGVNSKNVEGYVMGEHGGSQFVAWSTVRVNGRPIQELAELNHLELDYDDLEEQARRGGWYIHQGKGYTSFCIATCAVKLGQAVISDAQLACPVSMLNDKYQTYVGQPAVIGAQGVTATIDPKLTDEEETKLAHSAETIKEKFITM
ncbi:L-lactate dehydrogenase [Pediococcus argentinicus]|uniref:L-2-hydroxyisocaproate dehydrogenase n=1 Tax=Pediococcus argentinicus TaxID=480391 RepID=A0A0R2NI57_9LACO|nr:L-lactate dehydrogenase [Pediococcus argentinicus]KRO25479.1 L-2-hydroxyisocaproate dehydrogenase [Pediococcus argentinicus]NKZ22173.1 L-lactate dehydrogenase [Pediococcus argentinicus]GEP19222.1 L-lactate dehydrogenase [Pediococcus argentinicus]